MEDRILTSPLSAIRAFLSAAEFKNFTRTAEALGLAQPSLGPMTSSAPCPRVHSPKRTN
jgi:hypothetical protein